ncbi:hypothetical protein FRC03_007705 [Tulasnella sp. 419]|nr:hypothetical protein FRC03_007705 [Tulasnella sp. 419]
MATTKPVDGKKYDYLVAKLAEMNGELKRSQLRETEAQQTIKSLRQNMSFFEGQANKSKVAEKELQQRISELMDAYANIEAQANASPRSELAWERQKHHITDLADENQHLEAELGQAERQIHKLEDQVKVDEQKSKQQVEHLQKRLNKLKREKDMQNVHQASEISHLRLKLYNKDQRIQEMQT